MMERRRALDGSLPHRVVRPKPLPAPEPTRPSPSSTAGRASGRCRPPWPSPVCCATCCATRGIGQRIVPIIPDEARTFGLDGLFTEVKIYAPLGQLYEPVDAELLLSYAESKRRPDPRGGHHRGRRHGRLHRRRHGLRHVGPADDPVLHLLFDVRLPAGRRPDLGLRRHAGPGLPARRHRRPDHAASARASSTRTATRCCWPRPCPTWPAYDPAFAYEVAAIVEDGIRRMYGPDPEDLFYYLTLYNENYPMPRQARRAGRRGHRPGPVPLRRRRPDGPVAGGPRILFSGTASQAALEAQQLLAEDHDVAAELWSATCYKALREDALSVERWNRLHPEPPARGPRTSPRRWPRPRARSWPSPTS